MKKVIKNTLIVTALIFPMASTAGDMANGWSGQDRIKKIVSNYSWTYFQLVNNSTVGCGHDYLWKLPIDDSTVTKLKHSFLLSAYTSGKIVNLRCENNKITDFEVLN